MSFVQSTNELSHFLVQHFSSMVALIPFGKLFDTSCIRDSTLFSHSHSMRVINSLLSRTHRFIKYFFTIVNILERNLVIKFFFYSISLCLCFCRIIYSMHFCFTIRSFWRTHNYISTVLTKNYLC